MERRLRRSLGLQLPLPPLQVFAERRKKKTTEDEPRRARTHVQHVFVGGGRTLAGAETLLSGFLCEEEVSVFIYF